MGELFDHGVDSYSTVLIALYMFSLFGREDLPPLQMHFLVWNICLNFYFSHFEKYNTGVMFLPWAYDYTMWVRAIIFLLYFGNFKHHKVIQSYILYIIKIVYHSYM